MDLDRPLFRQLEKYAANSKMLYLRVMYYVISGVSLITDEVTRNYYFLQLKQDVVEGRISCDPKQAVILANYSRQAEYGNYQDRHTVEYLKTLLSFPKHLIEAGLLEALTEEVIQHHDEVHNITQGEFDICLFIVWIFEDSCEFPSWFKFEVIFESIDAIFGFYIRNSNLESQVKALDN